MDSIAICREQGGTDEEDVAMNIELATIVHRGVTAICCVIKRIHINH